MRQTNHMWPLSLDHHSSAVASSSARLILYHISGFFPLRANLMFLPALLITSVSYQSVSKNITTIIYNPREHWYYINCSIILTILNSIFQFSYSLSVLLGFKLNKPPVPNAAVGTDHLQHKIKEMKTCCVFVLKLKPPSLQQRNFIDYKPHCFKLNKMEI